MCHETWANNNYRNNRDRFELLTRIVDDDDDDDDDNAAFSRAREFEHGSL